VSYKEPFYKAVLSNPDYLSQLGWLFLIVDQNMNFYV